MKLKVQIIVGSTRPDRVSPKVAKWVERQARSERGDADVELIDLADYPMPFLDEPISPRYNPNRQINPPAAAWLSRLAEGDAYIFVTPEYNHSVPGVLKNALDYVTTELSRKPATIVSHGTVGGARAAMHLKEILSESQAAVIPKAVAFAGAASAIDDQGALDAATTKLPYGPAAALMAALDELLWYAAALKAAR